MSNWICYLWEQNPVHGFNLPFVWTLSMMLMGMQQRRGAGVLMSTVAVLPSPAGGSLPGGLTYFGWSWAREISVLPLSFLMVPWANTPNFQRTLAQRKRISLCLHGLVQCITVPSDGALGWCCWEAVVFSPQRANPGLVSTWSRELGWSYMGQAELQVMHLPFGWVTGCGNSGWVQTKEAWLYHPAQQATDLAG